MLIKKLVYIIQKIEINNLYFIWQQILCVLTMLISVLLSLTFPFLFGKIVDSLYLSPQKYSVSLYLILIVIVTLISCIISYMQTVKMQKLGKDISLKLKKFLYKKIMHKRVEFWDHYTVGELETILTIDVNKVEYLFTSFLGQFIVNSFTIAGLSGIILYVLKGYGIIIIILILTMIAIQKITTNKIEKTSNKIREMSGATAALETESLMKSENIYMSNLDEIYLKEFEKKNEKLFSYMVHKSRIYAVSRNISIIFQTINVIFILLLGAFLIEKNILTMDIAISMYLYIQKLMSPINQIVLLIQNTIEIQPSIDRVINLLNNDENIEFGDKYLNEPINSICFQKIQYKYNKQQKYVFYDMSQTFDKNTRKIVIVGENGKGKTTLIRILLNMCNVNSGKILINGYSLEELSEEYIHDNISFLTQTPLVFAGTLYDNINIHNKQGEERAKKLLYELGVSEKWVEEKKDMLVSDKNNNFSGGELQKIAITRVLLEDKPIIIMDEPTSALDIQSIYKLIHVLDEYAKHKLIIIISHDMNIREWGTKVISLDREEKEGQCVYT